MVFVAMEPVEPYRMEHLLVEGEILFRMLWTAIVSFL